MSNVSFNYKQLSTEAKRTYQDRAVALNAEAVKERKAQEERKAPKGTMRWVAPEPPSFAAAIE